MTALVFSCEHGGNEVPEEYKPYFLGQDDVLNSRRGWDIGILPVADELAHFFQFPFFYSQTSRLLIELNRSVSSAELFSSFTTPLADDEKNEILEKYYFSFRNKVEEKVLELIKSGNKVVHISFHSFTPVLNGVERDGDIGILFDPSRLFEERFCEKWMEELCALPSSFKFRFNYPYLGTDDGFTTYLRTRFKETEYAGIELEINNKNLLMDKDKKEVTDLLRKSFQALLNNESNL